MNSFYAIYNKNWNTLGHPKTYEDRNGCSVCVLGNYIYLIGGHTIANNENENAVETKLVERFDPITNRLEKAFIIEPDVGCMDVDCCIVDIDITENLNFTVNAVFFDNLPLW